MKRIGCGACALWVLVSLVCCATGPQGARWETSFSFEVSPFTGAIVDSYLSSEVSYEYELYGWNLASVAYFDSDDGLCDLQLAASGSVGAFEIASALYADPVDDGMEALAALRLPVIGIDLWGIATVEAWEDEVGSGAMVGAYAEIGSADVLIDVGFGVEWSAFSLLVPEMGFEGVWRRLILCDLVETEAPMCNSAWTYADLFLRTPIACFDVAFWTWFDCETGFDLFRAELEGLETGLSWLTIGSLGVVFEVGSKAVDLDLDLHTVDTVCVRPYLSVSQGTALFAFDGITLDALELVYEFQGVTFVVSELFEIHGDDAITFIGDDGRIHRYERRRYSGFFGCVEPVDADEAIGVEVRGDACCGAPFDFEVYTFFNTANPGLSIFDWFATSAQLEYGVASNLTLRLGAVFSDHMESWYSFGFEWIFGDPVIFGSAWWEACGCGF